MNVFTVKLNDMLVPGASYSLHKIMISDPAGRDWSVFERQPYMSALARLLTRYAPARLSFYFASMKM